MNVLITGASSGIGKALSQHYSRALHQVYACGRNLNALENLKRQSPQITPLPFDVTRESEIKTAAQVLKDRKVKLDLLIINAGTCEYIDDAKAFDGQLFKRVITTNLISVGYCLEHFLPLLADGARLVLVSSSAAWLPLPRAEAYGASKAALTYLGKTLAIDLASSGINVSIVHPGFVKTPLTDKNTFAMPMRISAEQAATEIANQIAKGRTIIKTPMLFTLIMQSLSLLPFSLWRRLARSMTTKNGEPA